MKFSLGLWSHDNDHCLAPDYLLADQGGLRALATGSYCFYVNMSGQVEDSVT